MPRPPSRPGSPWSSRRPRRAPTPARARIVVHHLAAEAAAPAPAAPPEPWPLSRHRFHPRHSQGGLGYPGHAPHRVAAPTVIHSGHLAGLGYVGIVTTPSADDVTATLPTPVGTTPVSAGAHGRLSRPLVETVAGVLAPHEPAPPASDEGAQAPARRTAAKRSRGRQG